MKFFALVRTAAFCAASLFAEETPASIAKSELPPLLPIYKVVHRDPELFDRRTADLRADREETESRDGLVVLVRTNMEAQPEQKESGLLSGLAGAYRIQRHSERRSVLACAVTPQALACW